MKTFSFVSTAALVLPLVLATGCLVPQNRYDEAVRRQDAAEKARAADEAELQTTRAELAKVNGALGTREKTLADREGELAQKQLDADRMATERDDAVLLVDQLRGELGRASDHLREFSEEKKGLAAALEEADQRAKRLEAAEKAMAEKALVVRDLTLAFGPNIDAGSALVTVIDGKPAVRLDARAVFGAEGSAVSEGMRQTLARLAAVFSSHPASKLELGDRSADEVPPEDRIVRLQKLADVLVDRGVGFERIGFAVAPPVADGSETPPAKPAPAKHDAPSTPSFRDGPGSVELVVDVAPAP
ncbi:MAG TPA: hypothetical protein VHE30_09720 [Polyangiaceae bacterium]|nr:hypothetical protein [Polyangiaceae bacterium]